MSIARNLANLGGDATGLATDAELTSGLASKLDLAGGKILQIVRATDSTERSTTSTSFVDVTGMSVTITPQKSDSAVLIAALGFAQINSAGDTVIGSFQITDNSNNSISGAERLTLGTNNLTGAGTRSVYAPVASFAYATPATTSATTYKLRFRTEAAGITLFLLGNIQTSQLYALEISA